MPHCKGHSLSEFGLVIGLVAIVAIGSLGLLGQQISEWLRGAIQPDSATSTTASLATNASLLSSTPPSSPSPQLNPEAVPSSTRRGETTDFNQFQQDLGALIAEPETVGSNGTERIAAKLLEMVEQLGPEGTNELNANDAALLRTLANNGFEKAKLQRNIERSLNEPINRTATRWGQVKLFDYSTTPPKELKQNDLRSLRSVQSQTPIRVTALENPELQALVSQALQTINKESSESLAVINYKLNASVQSAKAPIGSRISKQYKEKIHDDSIEEAKFDSIQTQSTDICVANRQNHVNTSKCHKNGAPRNSKEFGR
jgi:hypothetical protein